MSSHAEHKDHILPLRVYLGVGAALMVLTVITVWVSTIDLGGWNAIVAVGIASLKAMLVAFFFMHLLYDNKLFLIIFVTGLLFLTLFIALTMFDVLRRGDLDTMTEGPISKNAKIYDKPAVTDTTSTMPDTLDVDTVKADQSTQDNQSH